MHTTTHNVRKRLIAGVASIAIATVGVVSAGAAFAADPIYGNVTDQQGSITIHKHEPVNPSPAATPDGAGNVTGAPLEGVVFVAKKLNLDLLNKPGDWEKLPKVDALTSACGDDGATPTLTTPGLTGDLITFEATSSDGTTTKDQLDVGAYLVCEKTSAPNKTTIDKAAPFVVTVPFPDAKTTKGWLYNVHAYPKNTVLEKPTKKVKVDETKGIGATSLLTYTISNKIPHLAENESFSYFNVIDPLLPQAIEATVTKVSAGATTLNLTEHYSAEIATSGNGKNKHMQVALTQEGLKVLKANPGQDLVVEMTTRLNELPEAGQAPNTAYVFVDTQRTSEPPVDPLDPPKPSDDPETPPVGPNDDPGTPSNHVLTGWGKYTINKTADDKNKTPLTGAKFNVYLADTQDENCTSKTPQGIALNVNGGTELKSENGTVTIEGLFVAQATGTDLDAMKQDMAKKHRCYVLEEFEAPAGYVTPEGELARTAIKVTVGAPAVDKNTASIINSQITVPQLPLTGASGKVLMTIVGIALILLASGGILYSRKQMAKRR